MRVDSFALLVTERCNLCCMNCCQAMPLIEQPRDMTMNEVLEMAIACRGMEFPRFAISGGEPTMSPLFEEICASMRKLFNGRYYELRTNGLMLLDHPDTIKLFDKIIVSYYPGRSPESIKELPRIDKRIVVDVHAQFEKMGAPHFSNTHGDSWRKRCWRYGYVNLVNDRIYPCCGMFGLSKYQKLNIDEVSIPITPNWAKALDKIQMDRLCKLCSWNTSC